MRPVAGTPERLPGGGGAPDPADAAGDADPGAHPPVGVVLRSALNGEEVAAVALLQANRDADRLVAAARPVAAGADEPQGRGVELGLRGPGREVAVRERRRRESGQDGQDAEKGGRKLSVRSPHQFVTVETHETGVYPG